MLRGKPFRSRCGPRQIDMVRSIVAFELANAASSVDTVIQIG